MKLVPVRGNPDAAPFLYALLAERPRDNWISHEEMPTHGEHEAFVHKHSFRLWYLIEIPDLNGTYIGAIEATYRNELGIAILAAHQRQGHGTKALKLFLAHHDPLPPIHAERNGNWLANVATMNENSKLFFARLGFWPIQTTWCYRK